jgi:hypothetical protein
MSRGALAADARTAIDLSLKVQHTSVGGHEKLPVGGHESAH